MQENLSELAQKYREEMLRLYSSVPQETPPTPPELPVTDVTASPAEADAIIDDVLPDADEEAPLPPLLAATEERLEEEILASADPEGTIYEEPVLPDYILEPAPEVPTVYTSSGQLYVAAVTGTGAFPVENAHVTVWQQENGQSVLLHQMRTDASGETPPIRIPAPDAALSQTPGAVQPYALCRIRIYARGFYRIELLDVPVFAGVTSRQVFNLIPLPLTIHEDTEVIPMLSAAPNP